jgi:hypothetical protein
MEADNDYVHAPKCLRRRRRASMYVPKTLLVYIDIARGVVLGIQIPQYCRTRIERDFMLS